eukprot:PhM_4_TR16901/c0_g1_i1/m.26068/K04990/PKD2L1; polycystin 2L1
MFMIFFLGDRNIAANHYVLNAVQRYSMQEPFPSVEQSIKDLKKIMSSDGGANANDINIPAERTFFDIVDLDQWATWFSTILVPNTWDCEHAYVPRALYTPLGSTYRLGALKIRTLSVREDTCDLSTDIFSNTSGFTCYGDDKASSRDKRDRCGPRANPANIHSQLYTYHECASALGTTLTASRGIYPCSGYVVEVPFNSTCASVREMFDLFMDPQCPYIDSESTRLLTLEWFMYTAPLDSFQSIKFVFEIAPTGGWDVSYQVRAFPVWQTSKWAWTLFDFIVFLYVWYYAVAFARQWLGDYSHTRRPFHYLQDIWHLFEAINILCFLVVFVLRWIWMYRCYTSDVSFPYAPVYPKQLDTIQFLHVLQVYLNSVNTVISFMKLLLYLRMNGRMAVLIKSFSTCAENIVGVLTLFVVILLAYGLAGFSIYGSRLEEYHSVSSSLATLLRTLLGEFDYHAMLEENPEITPFYFWSYQILVLFLLLNFITAILSEGFSESSRDISLQPLREVILRQFDRLNATLHPRNLKKILELALQRKSRSMLLRRVIEALSEHLNLLGEHDPLEVDKKKMHSEDLSSWLPEELYGDLGDFYVAMLWNDIEFEYDAVQKSDTTTAVERMRGAVVDGVTSICEPTVLFVENLATSIEDIEMLVRAVTSKIETANDLEEADANHAEGGDAEGGSSPAWKERDWRTMF